jgi:hypothetical protein
MNTVLVSFASKEYYGSQARLNASARQHGIRTVFSYRERELFRSQFFKECKHIFSHKKGFGYWAWKPYVILDALERIPHDSILVYSDPGAKVIGDLRPLFEICERVKTAMLFNNFDYKNRMFPKRDCFVLMGCDEARYWDGLHLDAAFQIYMNNRFSRSFVHEWLSYAKDERIITDLPNTCGLADLEGFVSHRSDQSILSLLAIKYDLEIFRVPSQFGNYYKMPEVRVAGEPILSNHFQRVSHYAEASYRNSPYGTLLCHDRQKIRPFIVRALSAIKRKALQRGA